MQNKTKKITMRQTKMRFKKYITIFLIQKMIQKHVTKHFYKPAKDQTKKYVQTNNQYLPNKHFFKTRKVMKRNVILKK